VAPADHLPGLCFCVKAERRCLLTWYLREYMSEPALGTEPRLLAAKTVWMDTLSTYHRTWETGLDTVTRVTVSNPLLFFRIFLPAPSD
jgi:hypothetical protein